MRRYSVPKWNVRWVGVGWSQYVRIGESNRSVERHFTVNSVACHQTGIRREREDYSDPQGEGCVQSSSCNCPGARWFAAVSEGHNVVKVSKNLSWFGTWVGACSCASSNSLEEPVWHERTFIPPALLVRPHQVLSVLWRAHKGFRVAPPNVATHSFFVGAKEEMSRTHEERKGE